MIINAVIKAAVLSMCLTAFIVHVRRLMKMDKVRHSNLLRNSIEIDISEDEYMFLKEFAQLKNLDERKYIRMKIKEVCSKGE